MKKIYRSKAPRLVKLSEGGPLCPFCQCIGLVYAATENHKKNCEGWAK